MKKGLLLLALLALSVATYAQEVDDKPEMADLLYANGKIYVVVAVLSLIFIGIILFLTKIDRKVSKLEKRINEDQS